MAQAAPRQGPNLHLPKSTPKPLALGQGGEWKALMGWSWIPVLPGEASGREERVLLECFCLYEAKIQELSLEAEGGKQENSSLGLEGSRAFLPLQSSCWELHLCLGMGMLVEGKSKMPRKQNVGFVQARSG